MTIDACRSRHGLEQLETVFDNMFDAVFIVDASNGKVVYANRAMCTMFGYPPSEALHMTIRELCAGESRESVAETMDSLSAAAGGSGQFFEWKARKKDGTVFWTETSMQKADVAGEDLVIALVRDITGHKRAIADLQLTQFFVDKASIGIQRISEEGKIIFANEVSCRSLGYTAEELCSMTVFDINPTFNLEIFREHRKRARAAGTRTFETTHRRKDGSTLPVEVTVNYLDYQDEEISVSFFKDITERKRVEESLRAANLVVENSPVVLFRWKGDDEWPVELVSGNIIRFGYAPDEFLSGSITYSSIIHPDDLERVTREVHELCNEEADQFLLEYRIMTKGGDIRWVNEHTNIERDADGGVKNFEGIVIDVTERKLAEEELKRQKQLLQELNETLEKRVGEEVAKNREKDIMLIQQHRQAALGEMLDHIVHQWKQPLNSLSLIIQCLGETASDGELTNAYVEETVSKTMALLDHMAQTVNIFRGFYRQDREKKVFCIKGSIDQALAFVAPAFRFHSIAVELDVDPGLTAFGCPKEYAQVLLNILANARDAFKTRGTENPRVIIRAFAEDTKTVVTIADNAGGIPEAIMGRIFDFYFTTNESSGGTGIGLYMSKNIIEKNMGGTLSAKNTDGGAQFRIEVNLS